MLSKHDIEVAQGAVDATLAEYLSDQGYFALRTIRGQVCGVSKLLYTYGLCTRLDFTGYYARFCFERMDFAVVSLSSWTGKGLPPGPWVKQKYPIERGHPLLYTHKGGSHYYVRNAIPESNAWDSKHLEPWEKEDWLFLP